VSLRPDFVDDLIPNRSVAATTAAVPRPTGSGLLAMMGGDAILSAVADVAHIREHTRLRRVAKLGVLLAPLCLWFWYKIAVGQPYHLGPPQLTPNQLLYLPMFLFLILIFGLMAGPMLGAGKSPHVRYQPHEINVGINDVKGLDVVRDEVVKSLNLFLAYKTFQDHMGGNPRKAILFEGSPGTGKTYMAKAMAREAGVPFFFVSSSAFQSMYYGQTNRKIRSFFRALRKAAREEGGAIGFIEEIDAIAGARSNMRSTALAGEPGVAPATQVEQASGEGISGVVNELLIQLQSFEAPTVGARFKGWWIDRINRFLPTHRHLKKQVTIPPNILVIGATNRAADLDPALLRPGRFDRSIHFDLPNRNGRREIIDYYLDRKAHVADLDREERREQLASLTTGYTPVMLEHLFDEGLVWALREGRDAMDWDDINQAKMTEEIGLKQPVEYTPLEKETIATHEAGHAVIAYLVGHDRKLEVLSIIKRRDALGLLAHSDTEERFTRTRSELISAMQIAFGGMTAEELFFGESGTGPASDLMFATRVAAQMVGSFGMAGSLVSFEAVDNGAVTTGIVAKVLADKDSRSAVDRILSTSKSDVRELLDANRHLVIALRDALLAREELVGDEILDVLHEAQAHHALETATA
jgi:cell division protease FtsH